MEVSYLDLFLTFLKIGILLFGGGYGGIGVMYSILVDSKRWISEEEFLRLLAIAESTPGPIALNSATWIGYRLGGIPGSLIATTAIALPPYLVILGIVYLIGPYLEHWIAKAIFRGVNAAIVALILYAFIRLLRSTVIKEGFGRPRGARSIHSRANPAIPEARPRLRYSGGRARRPSAFASHLDAGLQACIGCKDRLH